MWSNKVRAMWVLCHIQSLKSSLHSMHQRTSQLGVVPPCQPSMPPHTAV